MQAVLWICFCGIRSLYYCFRKTDNMWRRIRHPDLEEEEKNPDLIKTLVSEKIPDLQHWQVSFIDGKSLCCHISSRGCDYFLCFLERIILDYCSSQLWCKKYRFCCLLLERNVKPKDSFYMTIERVISGPVFFFFSAWEELKSWKCHYPKR